MNYIMNIVDRIRRLMNFGLDMNEIHDIIMSSSDQITEEDFFLAYKAAELLLA